MRLFIGLPLPEDLKHQLQEAWMPFSGKLRHRAIDPKLWHLTIAFLDDVPDEAFGALCDLMTSALANTPQGEWHFTHFETFPPKKPTNIIAHAEPADFEAWKACVENLRDVTSLAAPHLDRKPWKPHVTIGKSLKNSRLPAIVEEIEPIAWTPEKLALVRSTLTAEGPIYEHLHVVELRV